MSTFTRICVSVLLFYVGWFACVLASRWDAALWSLPIVAAAVTGQLMLTERSRRGREVALVLLLGPGGAAIDTGMLALGILGFQASHTPSVTFVLWIGAFWVNFAATLNPTMFWFRKHLVIASVAAFVSAPGAYVAGDLLGALTLHENMLLAVLVLGAEWAIVFPVLLVLAGKLNPDPRQAPGPSAPSASGTPRRPMP